MAKFERSACSTKHLEPLLQQVRPRSRRFCSGNVQSLSCYSLEAVLKDRPINFLENVASNFDDTVRPNAENVPIKRGVVQLAECDPVRDDRLTSGMTVGKDVGSVEQVLVTETADGAPVLIRP
jgi:hypothetical protein